MLDQQKAKQNDSSGFFFWDILQKHEFFFSSSFVWIGRMRARGQYREEARIQSFISGHAPE